MESHFFSRLKSINYNESGEFIAKCPSNIALIKYWGKIEPQLPTNPSLSFTLTNSFTETLLKFKPKKKLEGYSISIYLDGILKESFVPRIYTFFERIKSYIPFLNNFEFEVHTKNTFPHSSGIASSASGMGALSLCLLKMEQYFGASLSEEEMLQKASFIARLGSGSASRSIYNGITVWGESNAIEGSSNLYTIPYPYKVDNVFNDFCDTILLIDKGEKTVSSSVGHKLMENHPYAERRFESAHKNLEKLKNTLQNGDLASFGKIVEHEALNLHAMMMTSNPYFILMKPNTLAVIEKVWEYRKSNNMHLYFTLDAGANIHLLYPNQEKETINNYIEKELSRYCINKQFIVDKIS